ncbi:MAG: hypothetical protein RI968_772 [Pseudomonadota bacterium]
MVGVALEQTAFWDTVKTKQEHVTAALACPMRSDRIGQGFDVGRMVVVVANGSQCRWASHLAEAGVDPIEDSGGGARRELWIKGQHQ